MAMTTQKYTATVNRVLAAVALPLDEAPAVKEAAAVMAQTGDTAQTSGRRLARYLTVLDPNRRAGSDGPTLDEREVFEAQEHMAVTRVEDARAQRAALEARRAYEVAITKERMARRILVAQAKKEVRPDVVATGAAFVTALRQAALLDAAERETWTLEERQADAMVPGGAFPRLAVLVPDHVEALLDALKTFEF